MDFGQLSQERLNYVRLVFTHPALRKLYAGWEDVGQLCVAFLHMDLAGDPEDPYLAEVVRELSAADKDFRSWSASRHSRAVRGRAADGQGAVRHGLPGATPERWMADLEKTPVRDEVKPGVFKDNAVRLLEPDKPAD